MFSARNATASIAAAGEAVALLDNPNGGPAGIDAAVAKLKIAEQVLWYE